jgi:predicted transcriptional regulator
MYNLTKKEKLDFIKQKIKELNISAYTISKKINLTEAGIGKILNGTIKNPHESTIDMLLLYLEEKVLASEINKVEETQETYFNPNLDLKKYVNCIERESKLLKEIHKLHSLLRKNNIEFKDFFEDED